MEDVCPGVTLEQGRAIVDAALKKARGINSHPMTIAVVDAGGCLVALKREDGSEQRRSIH
jgi:glc operon protein GlcG